MLSQPFLNPSTIGYQQDYASVGKWYGALKCARSVAERTQTLTHRGSVFGMLIAYRCVDKDGSCRGHGSQYNMIIQEFGSFRLHL